MYKHTKFSLLVLLYIGIVSSKSLLSKGQTIERFAYLSSYEDESEFLRAGNCNSNKIIQYQIIRQNCKLHRNHKVFQSFTLFNIFIDLGKNQKLILELE